MKKFDFSEIKITGSTGEPLIIEGLQKQIGDTLFYDNKHSLAIFEIGKKIAIGEPFDISENELTELIKYVEDWQLSLHVKIPFLNYLKTLQNDNSNNGRNGSNGNSRNDDNNIAELSAAGSDEAAIL